ncbi:magnesium chelatase [Alphaproteobacteria bacterium AO1-B]|nr:magnesium chelatase [Alphaproteobacteria bacterium AO1-B]
MADRDWLNWDRDGQDWPYREASQFVEASGYRWHVQLLGQDTAPAFLLIHGTGAASFSWRNLIPFLENDYRLIVVDLPCHGFTRPTESPDLSLEGMTTAIRGLLHHLDLKPQFFLGHSAGSVIEISLVNATRHAKHTQDPTPQIFSVNGALKPIRGNRILSPMAKALFANPLSASMFSLLAKSTPLGNNLLSATGSRIDPLGDAIYQRLLGSSGHVRGALGMMASWDLSHLNAMLQRLSAPLHLYAAEDDPMVPPSSSRKAAALAPNGHLQLAPIGGHLVHESHPEGVANWMTEALQAAKTNGANAA